MPVDPHETLAAMLDNYTRPMLGVAARLRIPDLLADGELSPDEIAGRIGQNAVALRRMMRALAARGVFRETADGNYGLTEISELLRTDVPGSLHALAVYRSIDSYATAAQALPLTIETGQPALFALTQKSFFETLQSKPEELETFHWFMASGANPGMRADRHAVAAASGAFAASRTIVDVGGGRGQLLAAILQRHPETRGVLFDLPEGTAAADRLLQTAGVANRVEVMAGDFFASVPAGADTYVLSFVLHDWYDEDCLRILTNIRQAAAPEARLLVAERILPPPGEMSSSFEHDAMQDVNMMVLVGGKERTEAEFARLFRESGFVATGKFATGTPMWVLEATAA